VKRGEIWTVSGGSKHTGKPRPAVIVQEDRFDGTDSITICAFTSDPTDAPLFRLEVKSSSTNALKGALRLMVDKIMTVPKTRLGERLGRLNDEDLVRLNRAFVVFLSLAGGSVAKR
jgi:mRNA interferase MazF